ncbi:aspartyl-tRNA synthetase [Pelomyxa schiedti]|nr:aspartyl-tRNA synthetase [Pelomyxa schiedti]
MSQPPAEVTTPATSSAAAAATTAPSKAAAKKLAKQQAKEKRKTETAAKVAATKSTAAAAATATTAASGTMDQVFGVKILNQSQTRENAQYTKLKTLDPTSNGKTVLLRGRVFASRAKGNLCFILLRQGQFSVQCLFEKSETCPKALVTFASKVTNESIVDIVGQVKTSPVPIEKASQREVEVLGQKLFVVSAAAPLPLQLEDLSRPSPFLKQQKALVEQLGKQIEALKTKHTPEEQNASPVKEELAKLEAERVKAQSFVRVNQEARLDHRVVDLRTPANHAIFRLQSAVAQLFREYMYTQDFVEIHTPKLIGCSSEGGANIFSVDYFDRKAYLAQSPQLYKQMAITADLDRVFEVGPVFRAENSHTRRHLTEFMGLDIEMAFYEHYHEVLDVLEGMFNYLFHGLETRFAADIAIVNQQYPLQPLVYKPIMRLKFPEAVQMLREAGVDMDPLSDLTTPQEIRLGELVKQKYNTDVYILDKFPACARPFYTMPDPVDPNYSNSYDIFLRGQEICSGSQRVHDPELLIKRATAKGVKPDTIKDYIDSFRWGAPPHAGAGIGLERVTMLYLGLKNIRKTSMFPRDPNRLFP